MVDATFSIPEPTSSVKRRGRPPKSAEPRTPGRPSNAAKTKQNVDSALATMNSLYSLLSLGALTIRRPLTAEYISSQIDQWQSGNREAFESSPRLTALISGIGQGSGVLAFVMVNGVAAFNVGRALREESSMIDAARTDASATED